MAWLEAANCTGSGEAVRPKLDYWPWSASYLALLLLLHCICLEERLLTLGPLSVPAAGMYKILELKQPLLLKRQTMSYSWKTSLGKSSKQLALADFGRTVVSLRCAHPLCLSLPNQDSQFLIQINIKRLPWDDIFVTP